MAVNPSSQQGGEYEELDAFTDLTKTSQTYDEVHIPPQSNPSPPDDQEYDVITTSANQAAAAVSCHGDTTNEFGYTDCAAYNVFSN